MDGYKDQVPTGRLTLCMAAINRVSNFPFVLIASFVIFLFLADPASSGGGHLPVPVGRLLIKVSRLYNSKDYARAVEVIKKFRKESAHPDYANNPELLFVLGNCYLCLDDYKNAAASYRKALLTRPEHAPTWLNMANAQYNLKDYSGAATSFLKAFELQDKKNPELLYYCGMCRLLSDDSRGAVEILKRLFREFPGSGKPQWKEGMARALMADDRGREALPWLREIVSGARGERKKQWSQVLLYQYIDLGMNREARSLALELARSWPEEEPWWTALIHVSLKQGRMEDALMALMVVSFLRPLDASETKLLADLNLQAGIPAKALPVYVELLDSSPSVPLLEYAVYACRSLGDYEKALELLEKYPDILSKAPDLMMARGDMLYGLSRYRAAFDAYVEAARVLNRQNGGHYQDETGRAWFMAGYSAWQAGETERALRAVQKAEKYPGQRRQAAQLREYLENVLGSS